jgi:hypothetical protein
MVMRRLVPSLSVMSLPRITAKSDVSLEASVGTRGVSVAVGATA